MQIIVSKTVVATVMSLKGEFELALTGNDTARCHHEGKLPVVDRARWNVTPLFIQGPAEQQEYAINVDDEVVLRALDFYFGCIRLLAPIVKMFSGFGELAERIGNDVKSLLAE